MSFAQRDLQLIHADMREAAQMWVSGLITDREMAEHFSVVADKFRSVEHLMAGLIDPNTGLRYYHFQGAVHEA